MTALSNKSTRRKSQQFSTFGRESTFLKIQGETYCFTVSRNREDYEPVRARIRGEINKRFEGWSDDYDRQFDGSAVYFLLTDKNGELRGGCRMVVADSHNTVVPVSRNDQGVEINFQGALEYSGLWFDDFRHCLALSGMLGHWVQNHFTGQDVYAVFEASNRVLRRIYLRSFQLDSLDHPLIAYDGFSYKDSGKTVEWQLAICRSATRAARADSLLASAGARVEESL